MSERLQALHLLQAGADILRTFVAAGLLVGSPCAAEVAVHRANPGCHVASPEPDRIPAPVGLPIIGSPTVTLIVDVPIGDACVQPARREVELHDFDRSGRGGAGARIALRCPDLIRLGGVGGLARHGFSPFC